MKINLFYILGLIFFTLSLYRLIEKNKKAFKENDFENWVISWCLILLDIFCVSTIFFLMIGD